MTTTDVVVAGEPEIDIGDASTVASDIVSPEVVAKARKEVKRLLENAVDAMKLTADDVLLIVVGGGSIVQEGLGNLRGIGNIIRPPFHDCANAVGVALARVSGQVDVVKVLEGSDEQKVIDEVCEEARKRAVAAGTDPARVRITEIENMPLQYVQIHAARTVAKAVGPIAQSPLLELTTVTPVDLGDGEDGWRFWIRAHHGWPSRYIMHREESP